MHDGGGDRSETLAALPTIIDSLRARGYTVRDRHAAARGCTCSTARDAARGRRRSRRPASARTGAAASSAAGSSAAGTSPAWWERGASPRASRHPMVSAGSAGDPGRERRGDAAAAMGEGVGSVRPLSVWAASRRSRRQVAQRDQRAVAGPPASVARRRAAAMPSTIVLAGRSSPRRARRWRLRPVIAGLAGALEDQLDAQPAGRRGVERAHERHRHRGPAGVVAGRRPERCAGQLEQQRQGEDQPGGGDQLHDADRAAGGAAGGGGRRRPAATPWRAPASPAIRAEPAAGEPSQAGRGGAQPGAVDQAGPAGVVVGGDDEADAATGRARSRPG